MVKGYDIYIENCRGGEVIELDRDGAVKLIYGVEDLHTVLKEYANHLDMSRKSLEMLHTLFPKRRPYIMAIDRW